MQREHALEPLGFLVDGGIVRVTKKRIAGRGVSRKHAAWHPQLHDTAPQLPRRLRNVLDRQERHRMEAGAGFPVLRVHEAVVRPAEGHGHLRLLHEARGQPHGGVEDDLFYPRLIHQPEKLGGARVEAAEAPAQRKIPGVPGEEEPRTVRPGVAPPERLVEILEEILPLLLDVGVAVHHHEVRHRCPP